MSLAAPQDGPGTAGAEPDPGTDTATEQNPGRSRHAAETEPEPPPLTPRALFRGVRASVRRADLLAALLLILTIAASGLITAVVWSWIGPHVPVLMTNGGPILAEYYGESSFGSQVTFGAIGVVAGLVVAIAAYLLRRRRGPVALLGLALGCLAAAWITWKLGSWVGRSHYDNLLHHAALGRTFPMPVQLEAKGLVFVEPLVAVLTYVVAAAWSHHPDLGADPTMRWTPGRHGAPDKSYD